VPVEKKASDMADRSLQTFFELRKKMATDRVEKAELYVTNMSVEDNSIIGGTSSCAGHSQTERTRFATQTSGDKHTCGPRWSKVVYF
jgi:hypothetical protein